MMTHDEMIAVIQADKDGSAVQYRLIRGGDDSWTDGKSGGFIWDFSKYEYRVKPEPRSLWISFDERGKPQLSAESAEQADCLTRIEGKTFFLFREVLP